MGIFPDLSKAPFFLLQDPGRDLTHSVSLEILVVLLCFEQIVEWLGVDNLVFVLPGDDFTVFLDFIIA